MTSVVPINNVIPLRDPVKSDIHRMISTLQKQGQIEPLQVSAVYGDYRPFHEDVWADAIICAARELGWNTLLITTMTKYEA